jgi:hypothetical protein
MHATCSLSRPFFAVCLLQKRFKQPSVSRSLKLSLSHQRIDATQEIGRDPNHDGDLLPIRHLFFLSGNAAPLVDECFNVNGATGHSRFWFARNCHDFSQVMESDSDADDLDLISKIYLNKALISLVALES